MIKNENFQGKHKEETPRELINSMPIACFLFFCFVFAFFPEEKNSLHAHLLTHWRKNVKIW